MFTDHTGVGCVGELFPTRCMISPNEVEETRVWTGYQVTIILAVNIIPISVTYMKKYLVLRKQFSKSHDLYFIRTNHSFHRYTWCHVIDTIIQLYMIVGLGIKLKSMSARS